VVHKCEIKKHSHIRSSGPKQSSRSSQISETSTGWLDSFKKRHSIVWNGDSYALARSISVLDAVNWIGLAEKESDFTSTDMSFDFNGFY
jgi:hypothetical protein